jgi:hypothetical protein
VRLYVVCAPDGCERDERDLTPCLCGCGEPVKAAFASGHDQRAIHERVGRFVSVAGFIRWFDDTYRPEAEA